jgi:hypothetical protein
MNTNVIEIAAIPSLSPICESLIWNRLVIPATTDIVAAVFWCVRYNDKPNNAQVQKFSHRKYFLD